jgi:7-carboxy-7-deazaguanine synthase
MFGANPIRKREITDGMVLRVQEIFNTIQGEGPDAGRPATFVRLWGCHLKCRFCDTDFESNNQQMHVAKIVERVSENRYAQLVVLTGGEPMRQNLIPLVLLLAGRMGREVQIETAGSFHWQVFSGFDALYQLDIRKRWSFIVSPKTPHVHEETARDARAFKYVLSASQGSIDEDGLPICNYQNYTGPQRRLARPPITWFGHRREDIFVQPMDECNPALNEANRLLCARIAMQHGYRISLQQHKILNIP